MIVKEGEKKEQEKTQPHKKKLFFEVKKTGVSLPKGDAVNLHQTETDQKRDGSKKHPVKFFQIQKNLVHKI